MTLFEYLAIAFSLVYSFSAMRFVAGLPYATQPGRRYWVHLTFVCMLLIGTAMAFWGFWGFRDADWTLPKFLLALAGPALLFFLACTLIPESPSTVVSWRDHYYSVRRQLFVGLILWALAIESLVTVVLDDAPWFHPIRIAHVGLVLIGILGASSANHRVHSGLALVAIAGFLILASTILAQPGSAP